VHLARPEKQFALFLKRAWPCATLFKHTFNALGPTIKNTVPTVDWSDNRREVTVITERHVKELGILEGDPFHSIWPRLAILLRIGAEWESSPEPGTPDNTLEIASHEGSSPEIDTFEYAFLEPAVIKFRTNKTTPSKVGAFEPAAPEATPSITKVRIPEVSAAERALLERVSMIFKAL
jgi:hypothetical protein